MSALLTLYALLVTLAVGLVIVGGLGYLVYRRPALKGPVMVAVTAAGVLVAFAAIVAGAVGDARASGQGGDARPGVTAPPSHR